MSKFTKDSMLQGGENAWLSLKSVKAKRMLSSQVLHYSCQVFLLDIKKLSTVFWKRACALWSVSFTSTLFLVDWKNYFCFKSWTRKISLPLNGTFCILSVCFRSELCCLAYKHPYSKRKWSHSFSRCRSQKNFVNWKLTKYIRTITQLPKI